MDLKWLDPQTLYESNSGADGGSDDGGSPPAPPENQTDGGIDAGPPPDLPRTPPAAQETADAEPAPVDYDDRLDGVFIPQKPGGAQAPTTSAQTPTQQPAPARPTADEWQMEPELAMKKQDAYTQWMVDQRVKEASRPIEEMRREQQTERRMAFQKSAEKTRTALRDNWEKVLNRDVEFRRDKQLRDMTSQIIGEYVASALNNGSVEDLQTAQSARFARRALALAKADLEDAKAFSVNPSGGPQVVGPQGQKEPSRPLIDRETAEGLDEASDWIGRELTAEEIAKTRDELKKMPW